jgi:hypothetical protein
MYNLSHVPALSTGPNTFTLAFLTGFASVAFSAPAVVVPAGGVATVDVTITANAALPDKSLYGGYIVFTPSAGGGQEYRVPYAGFKGDYQAIQVLVPTANNFPWVARNTSCNFNRFVDGECISGGSYSKYVEGSPFTLTGTDFPYFAIHFDHPSRLMRVEIYDANGKAWHRAVQDEYLPRNSTATGIYVFFWSGKTTAGNKTYTLPDGAYFAKVSVLKALGDSSNPAHWETWTSPMIVIDRP